MLTGRIKRLYHFSASYAVTDCTLNFHVGVSTAHNKPNKSKSQTDRPVSFKDNACSVPDYHAADITVQKTKTGVLKVCCKSTAYVRDIFTAGSLTANIFTLTQVSHTGYSNNTTKSMLPKYVRKYACYDF